MCQYTVPIPNVNEMRPHLVQNAHHPHGCAINVRVMGDARKPLSWPQIKACAVLACLLQNRVGHPLACTMHSAFKGGDRGGPNECPGPKFFQALKKIKAGALACGVLVR